MVIDCNTYLGQWPFRKLEYNTAGKLTALMDKSGIDGAMVSSINAIFYHDVMCGNLELMEEIQPYADRFLPVAVINPEYPRWEHDFAYCLDELGMKGLEIYPGYHHYEPDSRNLKKLMEMAAERHILVHVPCRLIDIRERHWMDTPENLSEKDIQTIVGLCDRTDFFISSCNTTGMAKALKPISDNRSGRIVYDFSRLELFSHAPSFQSLIRQAGCDSIVFATGAPFQYPDVQWVKLHFIGLGEEEIGKITGGNIQRLLGENFRVKVK
jgi:predicted TIM-barrel fold metal-dependent hydrolase